MIITKLLYALANQCITLSEHLANIAAQLDNTVQQRIDKLNIEIADIIS